MKAEYIQHMGTDLTVVNAARVSFDKESTLVVHYDNEFKQSWALSEKDIKLINYLAKHGHWTPFSHVALTMRETVPIFVARQRFKHMVGFTYNEVSRRYVDDVPEFFIPDEWRGKPVNAKQGSSDEILTELTWYDEEGNSFGSVPIKDAYLAFLNEAETLYRSMIMSGIAPEQARMVLPQSMYTSYYVTGSLYAWARAFKLRIDGHAQKEIQDLAKMWDKVITDIPELQHSWKALTNGQH